MPIQGANAPVAGALGRDTELGRIEAWLAPGAAAGPAAPRVALVIEGEPGIGKTTLWTEATGRARAAGWRVLSCRPAASDAGLPHVGLADLLRSVPDDAFGRLRAPQRRALGVALLREEAGGADVDPRAVGTGLTALLGLIGSDGPLMLAVDDAQWLDPASARALGFALRRLDDQQLRLVTAVRTEGPAGQRTGAFAAVEASLDRQAITRIEVGPLSVAAIHQMFVRTLGSSFARPVLVRIHQAAGGNPFYALEIGREVQRLGVPTPSQPLPIPGDHRDLVLLRLRRLPRATRDVLAVVAAMARPSTADLDLDALAPAEVAGIVRVRPGGRTEFTHPLFGSALYSSLPEASRRRLHRDLAGRATSPETRARHLALAADGPDEATADALDEAAAAAAAHGAADVAVELAELARNLTPPGDTPTLVRRETELAERRYFAGDPTGSRQELERFLASLPAGEDRALVLLELGSLLWVQSESEQGLAMMSQALGEADTPGLRARIHTRIASGSDDADVAVEHGEAALALTDENAEPQLYSYALLVVALFKLHSGRGADHAAVEKGMRLQRQAAGWVMSPVPAFWARNFDDFGTARQRLEDFIQALREQGDHAQVGPALTHLARIEAMTGHMDSARALTSEALDLAAQTDQETYLDVALCARAHVCAYAGELDEARACASDVLDRLGDRPDAVLEGMAREALGLAALQTGDLAEADRQFIRAEEINDLVHNREPANQRFQADHAEAVIGIGDTGRAERLVARLEARAAALPRAWILAVSCRCRGLLNAARADLDQALADYQRALTAHEGLDMPVELARTLLAQGRLHRRRNERQRAQDCLSRAAALFDTAGAPQWAAVARGELGRSQGRRGSADRLTATELQVAELAVAGLRNTEIAARLFLSGKTVEANLSRIYRKLGVRSRTELTAKMSQQGTPAPASPGPAAPPPASSSPATPPKP